jgi:hypothetical protein
VAVLTAGLVGGADTTVRRVAVGVDTSLVGGDQAAVEPVEMVSFYLDGSTYRN